MPNSKDPAVTGRIGGRSSARSRIVGRIVNDLLEPRYGAYTPEQIDRIQRALDRTPAAPAPWEVSTK